MVQRELPHDPGCYLFKDKSGTIIYVGKAKDLAKRVSSYFSHKNHDPKTKELVKRIADIDYIVTKTEVEALILENSLIKKNKPKYNIDLKDSKEYAYLEITDEEFPRLILSRKKKINNRIFGPFVSGTERNHVKDVLTRTFKLRTCKRLPKKACLRFHIKLCDAPCIRNISKTEYNSKIRKVTSVLKGRSKELMDKLKDDMKRYSHEKHYEKAIVIREEVNALHYLNEKQVAERKKKYDEDVINYIIEDGKVYLMLFNVYKGTLAKKHEFTFLHKDGFFEEFITQFYSEENVPKEIILPQMLDNAIVDFLTQKRNKKVIIHVPQIGEKKELLELVKKNIEITRFGDMTRVKELGKAIRLNEDPKVIECFDISHISGTSTVGSMVSYRNAKPDKKNYRRFKIRSYEGSDDTSGIKEIVRRRYTRLLREGNSFPNLIIIDGGKGQLSAATEELDKLNIKIPIISIAKKEEEIFVPGLSFPIKLSKKNKGLQLVQEVRDEAHRFAISYHRLLRKKSAHN